MNAIKQFCRLCRLSLLRLQLSYLSGAARRLNRNYHALYCRVFSRMFRRVSVLEFRYEQEQQRYLDAKSSEGSGSI